jgi:hypothetical protein
VKFGEDLANVVAVEDPFSLIPLRRSERTPGARVLPQMRADPFVRAHREERIQAAERLDGFSLLASATP